MNAIPNLPRDWTHTTLRSVCKPTKQWSPSREPKQSFQYIDVSAVSRESCAIESAQSVSAINAPSRARKIVQKGDSLFATIRPRLQRVALVDEQHDDEIASTAFCVLRPKLEKAAPRFLYYLLRTDFVLESIANNEGGASYPAVSDSNVFDCEIPLPPKPEQEKIAAILWTLQRTIATQDRLIATTRELKLAAMTKLFSEGFNNEVQKETEAGLMPSRWAVKSIGDIASIGSGGTPARGNPAYWHNGTIPWVKTGEVDYCVITDTEETITEAGMAASAAKLYPAGTLLVAMYGQGITRGKVALLGIGAATNQACAAIRLTTDTVLKEFLYHTLTFSYERLRGLAHGGQQQNLNADLIRSFTFGLPSTIAEQRQIADALTTIDNKIKHHQRKRAALNDLFQTLLHKLMTAEIRVHALDIDTTEVAAPAA